mmetsp:Transcript_2670/g.5963  ORF Transcript_2670/g.5963 Transcript_2670/m.5963 type:complete len:486 (-) Transcript_2670:252-1709(-)
MLVYARDNASNDRVEDLGVARGLGGLAGVEQVHALGGADGPVVVLSRAVDACKRLLGKQAREAEPSRHFVANLHHHQVLIDLLRSVSEHGCKLVLVGCDLPVPGAEGDPKLEALFLDGLHALERNLVGGGHVVIAHFLPTGGLLPNHRPPRELKVHAAGVGGAGDKEELLLKADVGHHARGRVPQVLQEPLALPGERLAGAEEGDLLVGREARPAHEDGGDVDGVAAHEDSRRCVEDRVAARRVRRAHPPVGVRRAVRLPAEELLAAELPDGLAVLLERHHVVVHLPRLAGADIVGTQGLEPVREDGRIVVLPPAQDGGGDGVGVLAGPGPVIEGGGGEALRPKVLVGDGADEALLSELRCAQATNGKGTTSDKCFSLTAQACASPLHPYAIPLRLARPPRRTRRRRGALNSSGGCAGWRRPALRAWVRKRSREGKCKHTNSHYKLSAHVPAAAGGGPGRYGPARRRWRIRTPGRERDQEPRPGR